MKERSRFLWVSLFVGGVMLLFNGCLVVAEDPGPVVVPVHEHQGGVRLIDSGPLPPHVRYLGRIQVRGASREEVRAQLRHEARRLGGDMVRILSIHRDRRPGRGHFRAIGKVYRYLRARRVHH